MLQLSLNNRVDINPIRYKPAVPKIGFILKRVHIETDSHRNGFISKIIYQSIGYTTETGGRFPKLRFKLKQASSYTVLYTDSFSVEIYY